MISERMVPIDVIRRKRDGLPLDDAHIEAFIDAYSRGALPDYQMSALAMAVFFRGLNAGELAAWTGAMLHSGTVLDLSDIPGTKVDKHSTGGVGDKISLPLAPLVAACGVRVPMVSGRGLGHTGGTLDKLESIPGFRVDLGVDRYRALVGELGLCLIGQTAEIAPADKRLYALRDVTSTIESVPLIASSIMSKKLAEGIDALVLDVKFGSGAFMPDRQRAAELARTMAGIGSAFGKPVTALLTSMEQPLGRAVGNALEVAESVAILRNEGPADVRELTIALGIEMLLLGQVATNADDARRLLESALADGRAMELFLRLCAAQGGDTAVLKDPTKLPTAKGRRDICATREGYISTIDTAEVGRAAMLLGAGRQTVDDRIDPAVGLMIHKRLGDAVVRGEPIVTLHFNDDARLEAVCARIQAAYILGDAAVTTAPLVAERIEAVAS